MTMILLLIVATICVSIVNAGTSITVQNNYKKALNIKIQGVGLGGCDVVLNPGDNDVSDCWCLWGTLHYSFCAYQKNLATDSTEKSAPPSNSTVGDARCPVITGENLVCNDLQSLGNCYAGGYACVVDANGMCHCDKV